MLIVYILIFIISLFVLIKGSDFLINSAEKIGLSLGLSPFIIGVLIVALGTSFPELISSIVGILNGAAEIVVSNAVGSNIANILLIVGISSIVAKKLQVNKSLIDLDLPLLSLGTVLFLGVAIDKKIVLGESILLLVAYVIYLLYTLLYKDEKGELNKSKVKKKLVSIKEKKERKPKITLKDFVLLILGIVGLAIGANYLIVSLIKISEILNIATGVISISAVALGTSLPELFVSIKAVLRDKPEVALGNVIGSNIFNFLIVVGVPGLFTTLPIEAKTFALGLPVLAIITLLFVISGISKRIYIWEGAFYTIIYAFFIIKLFEFF